MSLGNINDCVLDNEKQDIIDHREDNKELVQD